MELLEAQDPFEKHESKPSDAFSTVSYLFRWSGMRGDRLGTMCWHVLRERGRENFGIPLMLSMCQQDINDQGKSARGIDRKENN